ncbi:unnamed protein product [Amaranthus hypochondriacus]
MDSSQLVEEDKSSPETSSDSSLSPDSPDTDDIFGEPLVHPRVGNEYQVEIPSMKNEFERVQLMMNPLDSEGAVFDSSRYFLTGLPLPVMWITNQENHVKKRVESPNNPNAVHTNGVVGSENIVKVSQICLLKDEPNVKVDTPIQMYSLVPGQPSDSWSDFEADCFLLGLYMFGKNLLLVARFMEKKSVGPLLVYYYCRFYGSHKYYKWAECRKMKNRKCVLGHRFFTGYRQNELFARLAPRLSEESKTKWLEVSRAFFEGRTTVEEYVFALKAIAGLRALVEAVGIGKGKEDLTTLVLDNTKNNQLFIHRPEIPSGKACSSLTCAEIVKYLTGDFRLSKARSNDLFWEAVWPRLLARGWHSEQPRGDGYAGLKNPLVFLMPGIKKFSRRKLSKGDHYFDCVSDVLAKVAGEPELLELEADDTTPSVSKVENGWAIEVKSEDDQDVSDHERHCYLKPRISSEISNLFKFTVVDTSLANEDNSFKVIELRSLPVEAKRSFRKTDARLEVNSDTMRNGFHSSTILTQSEELTSSNANLPKDHKSRTIKHQFSRRIKSGLASCSGQATKRRRISSSVDGELTFVLSLPARINKLKIKSKNGAGASKAVNEKNDVSSKVGVSDVKVIAAESFVGDAPVKKTLSCECVTLVSSDVFREKENLPDKPKIDLNLPQVSSEPESDGNAKLGENCAFQQPDGNKAEPSDAPNLSTSDTNEPKVSSAVVGPTTQGGDTSDQPPRRQSTRSRPLTTKALEALEIGFLNPVRHSRKRCPSTSEDQKPKRSRQPRGKTTMVPPVTESKIADPLGFAIPPEKAVTRESLQLPETSFPSASSSKMFT